MLLSNSPGKLVLPFAAAGSKNTIPVDSQVGIVAGKASLQDGFPPLTRTPLSAGGVPPSGLDMNGILYEMSAVVRWANAGGAYPYDAAFATDANVNGYPKGARLMRSDGKGYWFNTTDNNTTDPEAAGAAAAGWVPDFTNGVAAVAMSGSNVTLTPLQYGKPVIVLSGVLSANLNLIFPSIVGEWDIINTCTGAFTVTCKTATGIGAPIALGFVGRIVSDATDFRLQSAVSVAYADPVAPAYLKTVSDIINGDDVSVFRFIPTTKHAGIQAHTNTDDLAANLTDAANSGAVGLFLPRGWYHSNRVTFPAAMKRLRGAGSASRLIATGSIAASVPWLFFDGQADLDFGNLELDLPKATYATQYATQFGGINRGSVSNIHMVGGGYMAMYAPGCNGVDFDNIVVDDYLGILFLANTNPGQLGLSRIRSAAVGNNVGIQIVGGSYHDISNCFVGGAGTNYFSISLFGANDSKVHNNIILATTLEGLQVTDGSRNDLTDNHIICGAGHHDFGISIFSNDADISHNKVAGNTIIGSGGPGIGISAAYTPVVRTCQLNTIENNTIINPCSFTVAVPAAIELLGGATCVSNTIQNNTCIDQANKMVYGAYEWNSGGNPNNNKFINNPCFGGAGFLSEGYTVGASSQVYDLGWTSFTPTITAQTGAITTVDTANTYIKYKRRGKQADISARITITTNGTGAGSVQATLPFTIQNGVITGRENGVSGKLAYGYSGGAALMRCVNYDATYPGANGMSLNMSGTVEIA